MSKAVKEKLSRDERSQLRLNEEIIRTGLRHFVDVGFALEEIRTDRLYREQFSTFEQYCQEKWGMRRDYADKLIRSGSEANKIYAWVSPAGEFVTGRADAETVTIEPANERQVRPLLKLPEEKRNDIWREAVRRAGMKQPTAKIVKEAAETATVEMHTMVCKTEGSPNREMGTMGPKSDGKPDGAVGEIAAIIELLRPVAGRHQKISEAIDRLNKVLDGFASTNKPANRG